MSLQDVDDDTWKAEFDKRDADGSGYLDKNELGSAIRDCVKDKGVPIEEDVLEAAIENIFKTFDESCGGKGDGRVSFDEFLKIMKGS